jgi:hypothetical protein
MRVGIALVGIGTIVTVITVLSLFTSSEPLPVGYYFACFLAPVGVGLILWGLLEKAKTRSVIARQLARESATSNHSGIAADRKGEEHTA